MFAGTRSVAQPDSPTSVEEGYPRAEDWPNDHYPGLSLPHGQVFGEEDDDERSHRVRIHGRSTAGRDVIQTGIYQPRNYSILVQLNRTKADVRAARQDQPFRKLAHGSLRNSLTSYEATLSDSAEETHLQNIPESDRREIEQLLDKSSATLKQLGLLTTKFAGFSCLHQERWLEEQQGREEFEAVRLQIDDVNKDLRDLTISMKRVKATIKKTYRDAKFENSEGSSIVQTKDEDLEDDVKFEDIIRELIPQGIPAVFLRRRVAEIRHYIRTLRENDDQWEERTEQSETLVEIDFADETGPTLETQDEDGQVVAYHDPRYNPIPGVIEPENTELHWATKAQIWSSSKTQRGLQLCSFAEMNNFLAVKYIVSVGAEFEVTQQDGLWSPLQWAAANGSMDIVELLLEHGAKVNFADQKGHTALHRAAYYGHGNIVVKLLASGAAIDAPQSAKYTPLHEAVLGGYRDVVEILCSHNADRNLLADRDESPLLCAVEAGNTRTVAYLLHKGVDVDRADTTGIGPLSLAASKGYTDIVVLLLRFTTNIDQPDKWGWTALHRAIQYDRVEVIKLLITRGANCQQPDNYGVRPIHRAAEYGSIDAIRILIEQEKVPVNVRSRDGSTPLHNAARSGNVDLLKYLLWKGMAEHLEDNDKYKFTPLYVAVDAGHLAAMKFLIDHGANVSTRDIYMWSLLHRAAFRGYAKITTELLPKIGAELKTMDDWTPLHEAAHEGNLDVVRVLVDYNVNVNAINRAGQTPLDLAVASNRQDIAEYLRTAGGLRKSETSNAVETLSRRRKKIVSKKSIASPMVRGSPGIPVATSTTAAAVLVLGILLLTNSSLRQAAFSRFRIVAAGA